MPVRIAIGLAVTVIALALASRRFYWLSRLIRSGQPAPGRAANYGRKAEAEVTEVAGRTPSSAVMRWRRTTGRPVSRSRRLAVTANSSATKRPSAAARAALAWLVAEKRSSSSRLSP